jgi:VIT1/CCC1 family predicted Fe2+/Mn2+ transporter
MWLAEGMSELHGFEPHDAASNGRLNWLRAGVLGANDGIVSIAALVVGIAAATPDPAIIFLTGIAALIAGAVSMGLGEYVSVSSQRDSELAWINKEKRELEMFPEEELAELAELYEKQGLTPATAKKVAAELTAKDALKAHLAIELNIDHEDLTNPVAAAVSSIVSFLTGAIIPLASILITVSLGLATGWAIGITFAATIVALGLTGGIGAYIGGSPVPRSVIRVVIGGTLALAITYGIGTLIGRGIG